MHPKNIYKDGINFVQLAKNDPGFAKRLKSNKSIDFHDPESLRQLTRALLKKDFKQDIELPEDRLCPAIPNRLNYILWLNDLITDTRETSLNAAASPPRVVGVDIGTGASLIYPLLGTTQFPHWEFLATELDPESFDWAAKNIENNSLNDRVRLIKSSDSNKIFPTEVGECDGTIDFCMCNPPFYESINDMLDSAKKKAMPPLSACTGATVEMVTEGGEVAFIENMIKESLVLGARIRWYTTMLGKLSSVEQIVGKLEESKISNIMIGELVQGLGKTKRWIVGWSFIEIRAGDHIARQASSKLLKHLLPFPTTYKISIPTDAALSTMLPKVEDLVKSTLGSFTTNKLEWTSVPLSCFTTMHDDIGNLYSNGRGITNGDTWSRAARRRAAKAQAMASGDKPVTDIEEAKDKFGFAVGIFIGKTSNTRSFGETKSRNPHTSKEEESESQEDAAMEEADAWDHDFISLPASSVEPEGSSDSFILLRWTRGLDQVLWESFCGMLRRKIMEEWSKLETSK